MVKSVAKKPEKKNVKVLREQLARVLADYDNLRKRIDREREDLGRIANIRLVVRLLPVYDMLESAQRHLNDSGLAITIEEFIKILKDEGIEKIKVKVGDKFNEEIHEAVEVSKTVSGKDGKIAKVILTGWRIIDGPIVRPVKVKVGKKGN